MRRIAARAALALALTLLLTACPGAGPKPTIASQELRPPSGPGMPYQALLAVKNSGLGTGEVEVVVKLRVHGTQQTAAEADETFPLKEHETIHVTLDLRPALPGPYDLLAQTKYPP